MGAKFRVRDKTIADQLAAMRSKYPQFETVFTGHSGLKVTGALQPTSRSAIYNFILKYNLTDSPRIKIVSPELKKNEKGENAEHLYTNGYLCLYQPKYREFTRTDLLTDTIIPWTSLWLYHYEVWHLTGEWLGGGEHPKSKTKSK
ncbi:MAG: hypothetical protein KJ578_07355 [Bacteroidetes bacterium]|nr:hypothetical protein [Bacteroidota bacterium]